MEPRKIRPPTSSSTSSRPESSSQRSGEDPKKQHPHHSRVDYQQYKEKKQREAAAAAAAKDGRPLQHQQPRQPMPGAAPPSASSQHHSSMKREQMKREMAAREVGKREGMKPMDSRRELPQPRLGDTVPPSEHKRVREEVDSTQKRVFESGSQPEVQVKRAREESAPPMHHPLDPSRSNHMHPSSHPLKRVRDNSNSSNGSSDPGYPPISQAKRPREGTDPMMDILDPSKRPREPMDSTAVKQEDFDSISSSSDNKLKFPFQEAAKAPQTKMPSSNFSSSTSQKNFHHKPAAPSRPASSNEMDRSKLLASHAIKQERPFVDMQRLPTLNISPLTRRSKSPLELKQEVKSPDMSRKIADVLSGQPSSHLFSPEDDREDSALPDVSFSLEVPPVLMSRAKSSSPMPKHPPLMPPAKPISQESSQMFTPTKSPVTPTKLHLSSAEKQRMRTPSLSGDSALVPVVRKLEDVPGFQSMNKSSGSIKLEKDLSPAPPTPGKDTIPPLMKQEPDLKSLLAESMALPTVVAPLKHEPVQSIFDPTDDIAPDLKLEHHHKKKKKEKHGKQIFINAKFSQRFHNIDAYPNKI
jgi:hypothetical protein